MNIKIFGAVIGALMLTAAMPAGAATFSGSTIENDIGAINAGDPTTNFAPANLTNGSKGINGDGFTSGQHYFDYLFKFTLTSASNVGITTSATTGTTFKDFHSAVFGTKPSGTALFTDAHSGLLIDLNNTTDQKGATGGSSLTVLNLATGSYFLHLFGVIAGNSGPNSHLFTLSGGITATSVTSTPIPAGLPLFATALSALGFMVWRRKTAAPTTAV